MSNNYAYGNYTCLNDCRREGCPGHKLRIIFHGVSDTVSVEVDGEQFACFDENLFFAIIDAVRPEDENDSNLGQLVRKMPKGSKLYRCVSQDSWNAYNGELCRDANGHTPEQALTSVLGAALQSEGVEQMESKD